jgi:hypothetical protein
MGIWILLQPALRTVDCIQKKPAATQNPQDPHRGHKNKIDPFKLFRQFPRNGFQKIRDIAVERYRLPERIFPLGFFRQIQFRIPIQLRF